MHRLELLGPAGSGKSTLSSRIDRAKHHCDDFDSLLQSKLRVLRVSSALPAAAYRLLALVIDRAQFISGKRHLLDPLLWRATRAANDALKAAADGERSAPLTELTRACLDELAGDSALDPFRRLLRLDGCLQIIEHLAVLRHWHIATPVLLEEGIIHKTPVRIASDGLARGLIGVIALDLPVQLHAAQLQTRIGGDKERNVSLRDRTPDQVLTWARDAADRNKQKIQRLRNVGVPVLTVTSHEEARDTDALLAFVRGAIRSHASSDCCSQPRPRSSGPRAARTNRSSSSLAS